MLPPSAQALKELFEVLVHQVRVRGRARVLMLPPSPPSRRGARPLAHPAARRGGDDENGSDSQMFYYLIFFSSACALRPAHPPLVSLHPTKGAISLVSFILATFLVAQFWRKSSARHASPIERRIAAPISLPVTKQAKPR